MIRVGYSNMDEKDQWKTMNGSHILVGGDGEIKKGPKPASKSGSSSSDKTSSNKPSSKKASDVNKMSREDRIKFGNDLCKEVSGANGGPGSAFHNEDALDAYMSGSGSKKFKDAYKKLKDARNLNLERKLNGGKESMTDKDLSDLKKSFEAQNAAFDEMMKIARAEGLAR